MKYFYVPLGIFLLALLCVSFLPFILLGLFVKLLTEALPKDCTDEDEDWIYPEKRLKYYQEDIRKKEL